MSNSKLETNSYWSEYLLFCMTTHFSWAVVYKKYFAE